MHLWCLSLNGSCSYVIWGLLYCAGCTLVLFFFLTNRFIFVVEGATVWTALGLDELLLSVCVLVPVCQSRSKLVTVFTKLGKPIFVNQYYCFHWIPHLIKLFLENILYCELCLLVSMGNGGKQTRILTTKWRGKVNCLLHVLLYPLHLTMHWYSEEWGQHSLYEDTAELGSSCNYLQTPFLAHTQLCPW